MAKQTKNTKAKSSAPTVQVQRVSKAEFDKLRKRSIRNKVIAGVCTFILGAGVGAGAYYGISDCWLNKDVPTPPPTTIETNNIYFDYLNYQLTEPEYETELTKFYNSEIFESTKRLNFLVKKLIINNNSDNKTLFSPCMMIYEHMLKIETGGSRKYIASINLSKLFVDNNLALDIPNVTDNYGDITWKIGKTNDTYTAEYGYAFRQLDNNDIILSIGFRGETATFDKFMLDTSIPIEIDI